VLRRLSDHRAWLIGRPGSRDVDASRDEQIAGAEGARPFERVACKETSDGARPDPTPSGAKRAEGRAYRWRMAGRRRRSERPPPVQ
jgi:hypothetical protein